MGLLFPQGLAGAVLHVLRLGEGQGAVVVPLVRRAGRQRKHQRLVIPEDVPVVQVEIVVPGRSPLEGVVKGGVQVIALAVHRYHVPGVAVFHAPLRGRLAEGHDAGQLHRVAQGLHRFGDALAHPHPLGQGADDLVGIGLFQLVIPDVLQNEGVDGQLLVPVAFPLQGPGQTVQPGGHRLAVLADLPLVEQILRQQLHMVRPGHPPVLKPGDVEHQRRVQLQPQIDVRQLRAVQPGHPDPRGQGAANASAAP